MTPNHSLWQGSKQIMSTMVEEISFPVVLFVFYALLKLSYYNSWESPTYANF